VSGFCEFLAGTGYELRVFGLRVVGFYPKNQSATLILIAYICDTYEEN